MCRGQVSTAFALLPPARGERERRRTAHLTALTSHTFASPALPADPLRVGRQWRTVRPIKKICVGLNEARNCHRREAFMTRKSLYAGVAAVALAALLTGAPAPTVA